MYGDSISTSIAHSLLHSSFVLACDCVQVLHADPKGLVPLVVVNQAFSKAADSIADMVDYMLKNHEKH